MAIELTICGEAPLIKMHQISIFQVLWDHRVDPQAQGFPLVLAAIFRVKGFPLDLLQELPQCKSQSIC